MERAGDKPFFHKQFEIFSSRIANQAICATRLRNQQYFFLKQTQPLPPKIEWSVPEFFVVVHGGASCQCWSRGHSVPGESCGRSQVVCVRGPGPPNPPQCRTGSIHTPAEGVTRLMAVHTYSQVPRCRLTLGKRVRILGSHSAIRGGQC